MELPTSLEERIALLEQEISGLLKELWNLDLNLKNILNVGFEGAGASHRAVAQQMIRQGLIAGELLARQNDDYVVFLNENDQINATALVVATTSVSNNGIVDCNTPSGWQLLQQTDRPLQPLLEESLQRLAAMPVDKLGSLAADMYFNPLQWQHSYSVGSLCYEAVMRILTACLVKFSSPDICDRLANRLKEILAHPFETDEVRLKQTWNVGYHAPHLHLAPTLQDCLELLLTLPQSSQKLDVIEQLILGEMDFGPFDPSGYLKGDKRYCWQWHFDPSVYSRHFDSCKSIWAYQIYGHRFYFYSPPGLGEYFPRMMELLYENGRFSYEAFCQCVQHMPVILSSASNRAVSDAREQNSPAVQEYSNYHNHQAWKTAAQHLFHSQVSPAFSQVILEYCDRLGWETAQNLSQDNYHILKQIQGLRGSSYLLQAVKQHNIHQLRTLVYPQQPKYDSQRSKKSRIKWQDGLAGAIMHMAQVADAEPESVEERRALVEQLKKVSPTSLKYLLPVAAPHSQQVLCEALGWQEALPFIQAIASIAECNNNRSDWQANIDVMQAAAVRSAIAQTSEALAREVWTLWREAKAATNNTVLFVEAIAGWNRAEIEQSLPKRKQLAVKAYGLLPLERGQDEVLERYLFLQQFQQESKQFGAERQASEQAAVQSALTYLAQISGYTDKKRFECIMEARLNQKIAPESRAWTIGDYQVELAISNCDPQITVRRGDKQLKSVPAVVRQSKTYTEIREIVKQLRTQVARFRHNFEEMMATGQPLGCDELTSFSRMPITCALLSQLVFYTDDNACGLFIPDAMALRTLDGNLLLLAGNVYIAHPDDLFHRGELAAWQQEIVRQRIVQPFKQVFRELYLLTPAEQETRTYSNRFAGHALDSRVVARLLQSRDWQITNGEYSPPCKVFPELGLKACFEFPDVGHFLSETEVITSDRIYFQPYSTSRSFHFQGEDRWLPLVDVPPPIFSEVMRDADLVVSVAQREGEARLSQEVYQRRGDLVKVLLADLGLSGVTVEGHFAHIQGKLACYRVHLGSAAIHIEPGHYLCIVPQRWGQRHDRLFLPFVDRGEAKISEVISKVLLLVNDDKIKDESIVRQIKAYT